ncbi:MAG: HAD family hydrolase [Acidimicrobiales bacterium]
MAYALFDWDNTLRDGWTLEYWITHLVTVGVLTRDNEPEWRALRARYESGRIGHNRLALEANRGYAREMAGRPAREIVERAEAFVAGGDRDRVFPWAAGLLHRLAGDGVRPVIITGALADLVRVHLRAMGLASGEVDVRGFTLAVDRDGRYTGRIRANPGVGAAKRRLVQRLAATGEVTLAAGDSVSDLPLLRAAARQLIVGPAAAELSREFGATATTISSPATLTGVTIR